MKYFDGNFLTRFKEYHKYINEYARDNGEFLVSLLCHSMRRKQREATHRLKKRSNGYYKKYHNFMESLLRIGKT